MSNITLDGQSYVCSNDETLLDSLLRQGKEISFSCRNGVCHACLMRATDGTPPEASQQGLSDTLQNKDYFLPCKCYPDTDMSITEPDPADVACFAIVQEKDMLSDDICRLRIESSQELSYRAGQFVAMKNSNGDKRSYSLASVPGHDYYMELHIKRHPQGMFSRWLVDEVKVGDEIDLIRPSGNNYYQAKKTDPLLLLATGTGLAPLIGLARNALYSEHSGDIYLYHGAADSQGLYLHQQLTELAQQHDNFHYIPCTTQTVQAAVQSAHDALDSYWVHISGNPEMVETCSRLVRQLGVTEGHLYIDPFTLNTPAAADGISDISEQHNQQDGETPYPPPSAEIWAALDEGKKLSKILDDFYDAVYLDPIMSPYFHNATKQRSKEKVYSFYRRLFSGEKVYFGDRPRNAHHWMVISDEVYDHREGMLKKAMIQHGLPGHIIDQWLRIEGIYRSDIVKDKIRGRMIDGVEKPAEGFGTIELAMAGMCDSCQGEIDSGIEVHYHLRTGEVYCPKCFGQQAPVSS